MFIQLSDHFTYKRLLRFTAPSIVMMLFTSIYSVVDGFFVSNFVGKTPFAAVNFIMPLLMVLGAVGSMFGTGGSALIGKTMGEGDLDKAKRQFSLFIFVSAGSAAVIALLGIIFLPQIAAMLGAEGSMLSDCTLYGRIILIALPAFVLQYEFQSFFSLAEKPQLGLYISVVAGVTNMALDALLVAVFSFGLVGAAVATAVSQMVGGVVPLIYFSRENTSLLRITKTSFDGRALLQGCANGASEFLTNISMSVVGMLYNVQLIKYAGENGVAAYGTLMYVNFFFLAAFIGYSIGVSPIVSYHFGAANTDELKNLLKKSFVIIGVFAALMFTLGESLAKPLSMIFVGYDKELLSITLRGFLIFSFCFLFAGVPIFGSSFFTALNNGLVSALISFLRTVVFEVVAVLTFPLIWEIDGIWLSVVGADIVAALVTAVFLIGNKKKYRY